MRAAIRLGIRLAKGEGVADRLRAGSVVLAGAVGSFVLLTTLAIARAEARRTGGPYTGNDLHLLLVAVVATVAVPVIVLVATTARLSATLRDRRLACLRLLGLSPSRTRLVAAVEAGATAGVGSVLGLGLFWLLRPVVSAAGIAGRHWSDSPFTPSAAAATIIVAAMPLLAIAVALLPTARRNWGRQAHAKATGNVRRPSVLRLAPLAAGLMLVQVTTYKQGQDNLSNVKIYWFMAGAALSGLGLLIVVPVFTRLLADLMVRLPLPTLRIAGRRLQAQPAAVSRIVAGLLVGLFVVTGARMVLGAFEDTLQYRTAANAYGDGPAPYHVIVPGVAHRTEAVAVLSRLQGVRAAYLNRQVQTGCSDKLPCLSGFVGTCADIEAAVPDAVGCHDNAVAWLDGPPNTRVKLAPGLSVRSLDGHQHRDPVTVPTPADTAVITSDVDSYWVTDIVQGSIFIPSSTPGILALTDYTGTSSQITVQADPGKSTAAAIERSARRVSAKAYVYPSFSHDEYDFVAGLRAIVWAVAAVVLGVGLLGFAIATVDRAVSRRAEMVSLQLVGTPRNVIRITQWWEASLPLLIGLPLAIAVGWSAGTGYLALGDALNARPWHSILTLAAISVATATAIAGISVLACAPRIRASLIRRS